MVITITLKHTNKIWGKKPGTTYFKNSPELGGILISYSGILNIILFRNLETLAGAQAGIQATWSGTPPWQASLHTNHAISTVPPAPSTHSTNVQTQETFPMVPLFLY